MEHPRTKDHVPPLLRGLGFLLILLTSLMVGVMEHRANAEAEAKMAHARSQIRAMASTSLKSQQVDSVAVEIRLLRLQLQEEDFADKVFENPLFQLLGGLGTALVALSFLYESRAKWPRRSGPRQDPLP